MSPTITYFGLFIVVLTILLLLRKTRQIKVQIARYGTQRMCPSFGLITSRLKASCLECGKSLPEAVSRYKILEGFKRVQRE
jgi:hypothetical protein